MSNSTRRFRRGGRPRRGAQTESLTLEIDPQFVAEFNAIGMRALENDRQLAALVKELSGILSHGVDDDGAAGVLDGYMNETHGEGHPQGLFGWFAEALNQASGLYQPETGEGAHRQPGSLAAPRITILVEYNRTSYPELEVPEVELALPLYVEEDGHWHVTNYPEEGPSEEQRHELIGLALDLLASPEFGFEEIIRAYHDVWERHEVAASTGDSSAS